MGLDAGPDQHPPEIVRNLQLTAREDRMAHILLRRTQAKLCLHGNIGNHADLGRYGWRNDKYNLLLRRALGIHTVVNLNLLEYPLRHLDHDCILGVRRQFLIKLLNGFERDAERLLVKNMGNDTPVQDRLT